MNESIALVIPGSVAAVRAIPRPGHKTDLTTEFVGRGYRVNAIVTETIMRWGAPDWGQPFVDQVSQAARSKTLVSGDYPDEQDAIIRQADRVVVFPATADIISALAYSSETSSPLIQSLSAARQRLAIVPAMNAKMWAHPAVQRNCAELANKQIVIVGPAKGTAKATTDFESQYPGYGRILDTNRIVDTINGTFSGAKDILRDYEEARDAALARSNALKNGAPRQVSKNSVLAIIAGEGANWEDVQSFHAAVKAAGCSLTYILDGQARKLRSPIEALADGSVVHSKMSTGREHINLTEAAGCVVAPLSDNNQLQTMWKGSARTLGQSAYLASLVSDAPIIVSPRKGVTLDTILVEALRDDGVEMLPEDPGCAKLQGRIAQPS